MYDVLNQNQNFIVEELDDDYNEKLFKMDFELSKK